MRAADCDAIATLLEYPRRSVVPAEARLAAFVRIAEANEALAAFTRAAAALESHHLEEVYVSTFELVPACVPYAGEHLFGEASHRRGALLVGLADACERHGVDPEGELPDHLAVLFRLLGRLPHDEARELAELCLAGPLRTMAAALRETDNPYRHLLDGAVAWLESEVVRA